MYFNLLLRTLSQALQAFTPIALALTWFERTGQIRTASAIRRGLIVAVPATIVASRLFQQSSHAALDEAMLATFAVVVTTLFVGRVLLDQPETPCPQNPACTTSTQTASLWAVTMAATLMIVRQTMEIGAALETAAIDLRLLGPTAAIVGGLAIGGGLSWVMRRLGMRRPDREIAAATRAFAVIFLVQAALYAFHEAAEARLLPGSEVLHAATEPYGPDGIYGVHLSDLLVIVPLLAAAIAFVRRERESVGLQSDSRPPIRPRRPAWLRRLAAASFGIASLALVGLQGTHAAQRRDEPGSSPADIAAIAQRPHLLFRDMSRNAHFGKLSLAPLDAPDTRRAATALSCERVSFAAGSGLCLHTAPGIFPHYTAAVFDKTLRPVTSMTLEGRPSRTRTSADGRLGAITVFVFGENYAAPFSTRTTLADMASGEVIGELEQFSTWRNGARFRAVDFNFWGVTFATDTNTFYATLRTAGTTYLVRGELALRRMTVLRENVECPSLSPDNRLIAFKKRVGPGTDQWRLAVLELNTMTERLIAAETRAIDDQVEWLDSTHVLYAVPGGATSITDVWVAPVDGSAPARIFLHDADSPIVVQK